MSFTTVVGHYWRLFKLHFNINNLDKEKKLDQDQNQRGYVEILPQSQTSVMNDCSTCREVKCRARSLKCEDEFLYISLINYVLYMLDTEG